MDEAGSSVSQPLSRSLNGNITSNNSSSAVYLLHSNVRIFSNAITALSKLGDELFLRSQQRGICLKAFNKTRSAYGIFLFANEFFSDYDTKCLTSDSAKDCRLSMKTALSMFKSAYFVEKNLVSCLLTVDILGRELRLDFQHTYDVTRSFDVNVMEKHKPFTSDIRRSDLCNVVTVSAFEIAAFLNEMHTGYEELMMSVQSDKIIFKNFAQLPVEGHGGSACRTEITVQRACFKRFAVRKTTEISFCMKEFKAILAFARQHACDVICFSTGREGLPLIVAVESDAGYSAEFIIATMDSDDESEQDSPGATQEPSRRAESSAEVNEAAVQSLQIENDHQREIARQASQNSSHDDSRQLIQPETAKTKVTEQPEDESMVDRDFNEGQALDDHMLMDDFVLW
ncbi:Rad9 [Cooperia oncophora]